MTSRLIVLGQEVLLGEKVILRNIHPMHRCAGQTCVVHSPTAHHMQSWPLHWRDDAGLFERICAHGIGHPDPDQFHHWRRTRQRWRATHGCDGCCTGRGADD